MKNKPTYFKTVVVIGSGKAAAHLCKAFKASDIDLLQIVGRNEERLQFLQHRLAVSTATDYADIANAELYIIAVSDSAIEPVCSELQHYIPEEATVSHCSGATPSTILKPFFHNYGVFYPLYTFSEQHELDFSKVPLLVFSPIQSIENQLLNTASKLVNRTEVITDEQRATLHVSAVFANNFSNHLFHIAHQLLEEKGIDFQLLLPILKETVRKLEDMPPAAAQSGPALRRDQQTILRHLEYLQDKPEVYEVYKLLTKGIMN